MPLNQSSSKRILFLLAVLCGLIILLPSLIYQDLFAQGDHGRDLYAFQATAQGGMPYRDYLWVYGPLMPYYYASFFKLCGETILSVLLGETLLKFFSGVLVYFIILEFAPVIWAFLAASFFWCHFPYFFYTYNHAGGILVILAAAFTLIKYIKYRNRASIYFGLLCIFLLCFVKINFGLCLLVTYMLCVFLTDKWDKGDIVCTKKIYITSLLALPLAVFLAYYLMVHDLPAYIIKQCLPYAKAGRQQSIELLASVPELYRLSTIFISGVWRNILFLGLCVAALLAHIFNYKNMLKSADKKTLLVFGALFLLFVSHLHEFILSGVHYRYNWAHPFLILMAFFLLASFAKHLPKVFQYGLILCVLSIVFDKVNVEMAHLQKHQHPKNFLGLTRGQVLLGNSPEWIETVTATTNFLKENLAKGEMFLALPYEPLYYYLLNRPSPSYQIVFFDYMNIPPEQDARTVRDLKEKNIRWVIFSNRIISGEPRLGTFGQTNSPLLAQYLNKNFEMVKEFGTWDRSPVWNSDHGIRVLKRK